MRNLWALLTGGVVGILGGLLGLGGAEFRLPLLVGVFRYRILQAIVINLLVSLVTVSFSFFFRTRQIPVEQVGTHWPILLNILAGSLVGSSLGVRLAVRVGEKWLHRLAGLLLISLSCILMAHHWLFAGRGLDLPRPLQIGIGLAAGLLIGLVSSMLGVAGGELIIPTLVLVFALDIKLAGSLSLVISVPTILMGLWRYHRRQSLGEQRSEAPFIAWMAAGSIVGAYAGSWLLRLVSSSFLHVSLGVILLISAVKMLRHREPGAPATR